MTVLRATQVRASHRLPWSRHALKKNLVARGSTDQQETSVPQQAPAQRVGPRPSSGVPPGPRTASTLRGADGQPLDVVAVEKTGEDAWAGVAAVDSGREDPSSSVRRVALLAGGDAAALLLFAVVGRINHGEVVGTETLQTALPFLLGWFATAPFLGGFSPEAQQQGPVSAAIAAARCWAVAAPLGLVLRGVSKGYVPPTPFIIVTLVATLVLLGGWRTAYATASKQELEQQPVVRAAARKNKSGGPLEFMQLLSGLVRRW